VEIVRKGETKTSGGKRILLATDGSQSSQQAARSVASRPWPTGTEVRVLSVVELNLPMALALLEPPFVDAGRTEPIRAEAMQRAQNAIAAALEILANGGLKISDTVSVRTEGPKHIILDEASAWNADLIVVGSHGRTGLDRFMLGSVSEAVATHAHCSVEVVRIKSS
jgi:nucleotide-binding universal stress UspA family protein